MFKIGDIGVIPMHGVGVLEGIMERQISGVLHKFYVFRLYNNGMTVMIPVENAESTGLRGIIDKKEIPKVYRILQERIPHKNNNHSWNKRYREYMEKLKSGSIFDVAVVLRDLCLLQCEKPLSFGEKKMLEAARNLLVREISLAKNIKEEIVEREIMKIISPKSP